MKKGDDGDDDIEEGEEMKIQVKQKQKKNKIVHERIETNKYRSKIY